MSNKTTIYTQFIFKREFRRSEILISLKAIYKKNNPMAKEKVI
jgi:hypothetical protein